MTRLRSGSIRAAFHLAVVTTVLASFPAMAVSAETQRAILELDPGKTSIRFTLEGSLHTTHGTFALKRGTVRVEPATGQAEGSILVDASSGESGNGARDRRMTESIIEAQKYPDITFSPQHIDGHPHPDGDFQAKVTGILQLHGTDHQIVFDTQGHLSGQRLTMRFHLVIPYVEWGLKDPSILLFTVSKEVDVEVTAEGWVTWITH